MNQAEALLQRTLKEEIPITEQMGIRVSGYDGESLRLSAPLRPNTNHKATVFGGSLYSVAVACGWGLLFLKLRELGVPGHIVIHRGQINYLRPVSGDFVAIARLPDGDAMQRLTRSIARHGRGRVTLKIEVPTETGPGVELSGDYVVHR